MGAFLVVLGHLGRVLGGSWGLLGWSWGLLGTSWGRLGRQIQNRARATCFWNRFLDPFWRGLGASWAPSGTSWRVFLPLLGRLGPVLTKTSKKVRFWKSRKRFFNHFDAFETLKFSVSPRREPYFSKKHLFIFFVFCAVLACLGGLVGLILEVLGSSWSHLGPSWAWSRQVKKVRSS